MVGNYATATPILGTETASVGNYHVTNGDMEQQAEGDNSIMQQQE